MKHELPITDNIDKIKPEQYIIRKTCDNKCVNFQVPHSDRNEKEKHKRKNKRESERKRETGATIQFICSYIAYTQTQNADSTFTLVFFRKHFFLKI